MKITTVLAAIVTAGILSAGEIKLPELVHKGRTYKNTTIAKADETTAKITHADGIARIPIADLPESVRTAIGYDPAAAEKATARAEADASIARMRARLIASGVILKMTVRDISSQGIAGSTRIYNAKGEFQNEDDVFFSQKGADGIYISGKVYELIAIPADTYKYTTILGATRVIPRYIDLAAQLKLLERPAEATAKKP